ncbi:MAG: monovalent cation/H(+) antiporter subunit G [Deltaproteobacteria bacterium]|jgi:multicomponent Na+:H+ antiporter subunit G|nr:monovalent cation/H(+) antiporter subunit G [Deltaproteobacteria bacterium]
MNDWITALLFILGSLFSLVAALGMLRLPDTVIRMHAATKAGTLGAGLILIGEAFFYAELGITLRALAAIMFLLLTAPVAAHLIGRAAYYSRVKLWEKTWIDQLAERFSADSQSAPDAGKREKRK